MINGAILVGASEQNSELSFFPVNAATGETLPQRFSTASADDVDRAANLAAEAFPIFSATDLELRANFLESIADAIMAIGDELITTAMAETGLPRPRLENERGRTTGQLRLFAAVVRQGDWLDVTIDPKQEERLPAPRADLRRVNVAIGPIAVFGASNFPLAFSVAGGDTASALASGCPVVVKGHPAHPGTGELVARAVRSAVTAFCLSEGVFSYLPGVGNDLGVALVGHPSIKGVGFTGSRSGGLALAQVAAERPDPIPVFAEMSSVNPVILLSGALAARAEALGKEFVQSLSLGAGQFCTNPGIVIALGGADLDRFAESASSALNANAPAVMLTPSIQLAYEKGIASLDAHAAVVRLAGSPTGIGAGRAHGALFETSAAAFLADADLAQEVFGASGLIVRCGSMEEVKRVLYALEGQLTATVHHDEGDDETAQHLLPILAAKAGRVLLNGWPTGVEVTHAMVHGGPFPATTDGRSTSVGSAAIGRYVRPVCYQDVPDAWLPPPLQDANPWQVARRIDGVVERP